MVSGFIIWAATIELPDFSLFETRKVSESTKIYDRTGKILLYDVHKDIRRTVVGFDNISPYVKNATVAIEDDQFYQHHGIEPKAILRAILVNLRLHEGYLGQGGSTITQQVIKMALLSNERTVSRKLKEWILALRLERIMNKEAILGLYLNEAPYGGNIYGVEEASRSFFGKSAKDIDLAESAYLAALPQAPTLYSPYGSHADQLEARKNQVLRKMLSLGSVTQAEYDQAIKERVVFLPLAERGIRAPHFVMFIKEQLAEKYGEDMLNEGGLSVITTIDLDLQTKGEEIVKQYAEKNEKDYNAHNAALVAIDPKSGEILTMVGSRDYFEKGSDGNYNIAIAKRQPGSSFKPFVYAAGFEQGYTPDTSLFDLPTEFSTHCNALGAPSDGSDPSVCYMPENYDHQYRGPITIREALAQSVNVPAVKMLYLVGVDNALAFARRMGITTLLNKERYGLTLVLGGGEVSLLEMTSAYGVFANDGKRVPYQAILKVVDRSGTVLEEYKPQEEAVMDPEIARNITDILVDNAARTPAFGAQSYLYFPERQVAVKTGTTNDYRDAWIIGYTPSLVVGAWAGNNDNTPMEKKVAGFIIAPMWNAFFKSAFSSIPEEVFPKPLPISLSVKPALRGVWYGNSTYIIDKYSQKLATDQTPPEAQEERVIADPHEILHWVDKSNPTGPAPTDPTTDPQYWLWEIPARSWINLHGVPQKALAIKPSAVDDIHTSATRPQIELISPTSTDCVLGEQLNTVVNVKSSFGMRVVDLFLNDIFINSIANPPYVFSFIPNQNSGVEGRNDIRIVAHDVVDNSSELITQINCTQ
jgi:1A family penicillin-binding protein